MAEWWVRFLSQSGNPVGEYTLAEPTVDILNSDVGGFSGEIALGQTRKGSAAGITRDQFAPYRTHYEIKRQSVGTGNVISSGMITSVNLNKDRDTILVSGKDWAHYLQRRVYPFKPEAYIAFDGANEFHYWPFWPRKWFEPVFPGEIPLKRVIRDLLASMRTDVPLDYRQAMSLGASLPSAPGVPPITWNIDVDSGPLGKYKIYPGDQTSIFDHIQAVSELSSKGFDWDIHPETLEFRLWYPRKYVNDWAAHYQFISSGEEAGGQIVEFDWTNEGPDGTYLYGYGATDHKIGATWKYNPSINQFGRYDLVYDYGEVSNYEMILDRLKDQNDLHPQKKLSLALLNPEFLTPNFYTGGRPRALLGAPIQVLHDFTPYHRVDAHFRVNAIRWAIDGSSNETVTLELEMIYEPSTGYGTDG